ncbi:MAG TPA: polyketide cyclase [Rhodanobacteraceae bacterium]|jgi:hypothetical protein|nr:polyketide cyclase [Rhodanobacteraceae bacterium]
MTRVLEFVVALIMVFVLAVIVGLFLPSSAHIERSIQISHNPRHIFDVLNNFRRYQDYAGGELTAQDPATKFTLSGPAYGQGATISWSGSPGTVGDGSLVNKSGNIDITNKSEVVWDLTNNWRGTNKVFTVTVVPNQRQNVSTVTWSYDVDYGWNLIARYSQLWIHGEPAATIQYGLDGLQTMLAGINNGDYTGVNPGLYRMPATPMLLVSVTAPYTVDDLDSAKTTAMQQISSAMGKLGVKAAGPTTTIATSFGDGKFTFDLAVPIDTSTLTIDGKSYDLATLPPRPTSAELEAAAPASASSTAPASGASAATPASASSSAPPATAAANAAPVPGSLDKMNQLIVDANVRAMIMPASEVLEGTWTGQANVRQMRLNLQAYAATHGYKFDVTTHRLFDQLASMPTVQDQDKVFRVYLPVEDAPAQTPEQAAGESAPLTALDPALWSGASTQPAADSKPAADKPEARKKPEHHKGRRHHR